MKTFKYLGEITELDTSERQANRTRNGNSVHWQEIRFYNNITKRGARVCCGVFEHGHDCELNAIGKKERKIIQTTLELRQTEIRYRLNSLEKIYNHVQKVTNILRSTPVSLFDQNREK